MVREDAVLGVGRVGEEGGQEGAPDGGVDEDGVAEEEEGRVRVGAAAEGVAELGAVGGRDGGCDGGGG